VNGTRRCWRGQALVRKRTRQATRTLPDVAAERPRRRRSHGRGRSLSGLGGRGRSFRPFRETLINGHFWHYGIVGWELGTPPERGAGAAVGASALGDGSEGPKLVGSGILRWYHSRGRTPYFLTNTGLCDAARRLSSGAPATLAFVTHRSLPRPLTDCGW